MQTDDTLLRCTRTKLDRAFAIITEAANAATDGDAPPANPRPGERHWFQASAHGVLLHVFEEVCQHLGQLEITRDPLRAQH